MGQRARTGRQGASEIQEQAMKQAEEYKNWVPSEDDEKYRIRYIEAE